MTTHSISPINITIEALGVMQTYLPQALSVQCKTDSPVREVLSQVIEKFPDAYEVLERCACAVGEDMVSRCTVLDKDCTLVLLSPVAGG